MSLRDALLKAGKVSKQDARKAATEERKKRKRKKGHRIEAEKEAEKQRRHEERLAQQREEDRKRAEREKAEREAQERKVRVKNLSTQWRRTPGNRDNIRWHFVRSNGSIGFLQVDSRLAAELEHGSAAIIEVPIDDVVRIVSQDGVDAILETMPQCVRFYVGRGAPEDEIICPPALAA